MGCNPNTVNCTPEEVLAATAIPSCGKFVNVSNLQAEQLIFDQAYNDLINNYGIDIKYYFNSFNLSAANLLYGEEPTKKFEGPLHLQMYVELNNEAISLQSFGFDAADEFTGYIHIDTFYDAASAKFDYAAVGQSIEPKSGDLVIIDSLSCNRQNGRGAKVYEITERMDQDVSAMNPLLGTYTWRVRAKRYDYSFEPGAPIEPVNEQIFENSFSGILSTSLSGDSVSPDKSYDWNINEDSQDNVYDMDTNDNDIYGNYY